MAGTVRADAVELIAIEPLKVGGQRTAPGVSFTLADAAVAQDLVDRGLAERPPKAGKSDKAKDEKGNEP